MNRKTSSLQQLGESPQMILLPHTKGDTLYIMLMVATAIICFVSLFIVPVLFKTPELP